MATAIAEPLVLVADDDEDLRRALWRLGPRPDDCMRKQSLDQLEDRVRILLEERR